MRSLSPKQYNQAGSSTYATSISVSITADEAYSNALLFIHATGVNVGHGTSSLTGVTSSQLLYTLSGGGFLDGFIYQFSCAKNSVITAKVAHSSTGGGTSHIAALIMA